MSHMPDGGREFLPGYGNKEDAGLMKFFLFPVLKMDGCWHFLRMWGMELPFLRYRGCAGESALAECWLDKESPGAMGA